MSYPVWLSLIFCFLASARADGIDVDDPDVFVLTTDNFSDFVNNNDFVLVEFYAPWCGHCKNLAPEYAKAATNLKLSGSPVKLGKVDATVESSLGSKFDVRGYPTLKFFKNGEATDYNGGRTEPEIVSWVNKKSRPVSQHLQSEKDVEAFTSNAATRIVAYLQPIDAPTWLKLVSADRFDGLTFGHVTDSSLFGDRVQGTIEIYKDGAVVSDNGANEKLLELIHKTRIQQRPKVFSEHWSNWLLDTAFPLVDTYSEQVQARAEMKKRELLVVFGSSEAAKAAAESIATSLKGKVVVATSDNIELAKNWGASGNSLPTAVVTIYSKKPNNQFIWNEDTEETFNAETLTAFIEAAKKGTYSSYIKSEPVPENNGPVDVIVGKTLQSYLTSGKDVFIKFYAPWCGHCKTLAPIWEELGEAFQEDPNVTIAKFDATANKLPHNIRVSSYPTLIFFNAKGKQLAYNGERNLEALKKYVDSRKTKVEEKKEKKEEKSDL